MADSIKLLIGPYKSGKTTRALGELLSFKATHPLSPCTILVPSARHRTVTQARVAAMLEHFKLKMVFDLRIQAFYPFCETILKSSQSSYRVVPEDVRSLVLSAVLQRMRTEGKLKHLAKLVGFQGTSAALLKLIDEFERGGYTPASILLKLGESSGDESRYVELATIYDAYWRELDRMGCIDQKRIAFEAREALFARRPDNFHHGMILIEGFDRISALQADIALGLSRYCENIWMTFDYLEQAHEAAGGPTYEWNESSFANLQSHMQPELVRHPIAPRAVSTTGDHIQLFRALDRYAEMHEVAARCKRAILNGTKPNQLLVVARRIDNYRGAAEAAFEAAGVPYFLDHSVSAEELPFIQFMRELLKLPVKDQAGGDFQRARTIACLRSKYLNTAALGITPADIDRLDSLSLNAALINGTDQWAKVLDDCSSDLRRGMHNFFSSLRVLMVSSSAAQHCSVLEDFLEKLVSLPSGPARDVHNRLVQQARQGESILRRCLQTFIQEEQLLHSAPLSYKEFLSKLDSLLVQSNFTNRGGADAVLITSADTAPNSSFAEIFVIGLVEGEFPKRGGQAGFAGPDELARWTRLGVELRNPRSEPGFETALYKSLFSRAEQLTLSFPQFEMGGDERTPSFFIAEAQGTHEANVPLTEPLTRGTIAPTSAQDALGGWLWYQQPDNLDLPEALAVNSSLATVWEGLNDPINGGVSRLSGGPLSVYNGYLVPLVETQSLTVAPKTSWSATQLNNYGQCPFKYWLSGVLKYSPRKESEPVLSAKLQGTTYHKVLELYYKRLTDEGTDYASGVNDSAFDEAMSAGFEWLSRQKDFNAGPYWTNEQQDIRLRLRRFLEWESKSQRNGARPFQFEVKFGREDPLSKPPLLLDTDCGTVKISGAIDRIDLESSLDAESPRVHLVDYKSGSRSMKTADAFEGTNIQLPLYALAVEDSVLPGSTVATASYLSVRQASVVGHFAFKTEAHMQLLNTTKDHVGKFVSGASSGDFRVNPANSDVCTNCDHVTVCRIAELRHAQSEGDDDDE